MTMRDQCIEAMAVAEEPNIGWDRPDQGWMKQARAHAIARATRSFDTLLDKLKPFVEQSAYEGWGCCADASDLSAYMASSLSTLSQQEGK